MSVINSEIDRKTKQEAFWAEGIVEFVKLDKFNELKTSWIKVQGQPDKKIESTHRASILVKDKASDDQVWIALGDVKLHPEHENLQVKKEEEWITIQKGVEVTLDVKVNEYQGKTYYQSSKGKINVLSTEGVAKSPSKPAAKDEKESYDNTGQLVGHAVGGAASLSEKGIKGDLGDLAKIFHVATTKAKESIAKATGQNANSRNLGMSVGNAINSAVKLISKSEKDVEGFLVKTTIEIYNTVTVPTTEFIKSGGKVVEVPDTTGTASSELPESPTDFDDDIPF